MLRISFTTKSSKNLVLSINVAKNDKVGIKSRDNCKAEIVKKLTSKNLNRFINYLTPNVK